MWCWCSYDHYPSAFIIAVSLSLFLIGTGAHGKHTHRTQHIRQKVESMHVLIDVQSFYDHLQICILCVYRSLGGKLMLVCYRCRASMKTEPNETKQKQKQEKNNALKICRIHHVSNKCKQQNIYNTKKKHVYREEARRQRTD